MYSLQVSTMGGPWSEIFEHADLNEVRKKQDIARFMPMTSVRVVKKCNHCGDEIELRLLAEFDNQNICPKCHLPW